MTRHRLLLAGTITLAGALSVWLIIGAGITWSVCCGWLVSRDFAVALSVAASLNVFGLLAFGVRSRTWGASTLVAVQAGNVLFALAASALVSPAWLVNVAPASAILILVLLVRKSHAAEHEATV